MVAPLVQQSSTRLGRAFSTIAQRRATTKVEPTQETQQALFEAELEQGRLQAQEQSRVALQAEVERERIAESKRASEAAVSEARRRRKQEEVSDLEKGLGFVLKMFGK